MRGKCKHRRKMQRQEGNIFYKREMKIRGKYFSAKENYSIMANVKNLEDLENSPPVEGWQAKPDGVVFSKKRKVV